MLPVTLTTALYDDEVSACGSKYRARLHRRLGGPGIGAAHARLSTGTIAVGALCAADPRASRCLLRDSRIPSILGANFAWAQPWRSHKTPSPHERQIYDLFGAQDLDWYAIATKVQGILGISVRHEPVEISTMVTALPAVWNPKGCTRRSPDPGQLPLKTMLRPPVSPLTPTVSSR